jgi:membrane protein implicated in regulation of membrane protease activity
MTRRQVISFSIEAALLLVIMAGMAVMMGIGFSQAKIAEGPAVHAFGNIAWLSLLFFFIALILLAWRVMRLFRSVVRQMGPSKAADHPDAWTEAGRRMEMDHSGNDSESEDASGQA